MRKTSWRGWISSPGAELCPPSSAARGVRAGQCSSLHPLGASRGGAEPGGGMWDLGFGLWDLGSGIWDLESGIWALGSGIWDLDSWLWDLGLGIGDLGSGLWDLDSGMWVLGFGTGDLGSGLWALGFGLWALGSGITPSGRHFHLGAPPHPPPAAPSPFPFPCPRWLWLLSLCSAPRASGGRSQSSLGEQPEPLLIPSCHHHSFIIPQPVHFPSPPSPPGLAVSGQKG